MTNPLSPLVYGKVVGRLLAGIIDSPDIGEIPDFPPLEGRVTFTAAVPKFLVPLADPPATVAPLTNDLYTCVLDDEGFLTWRGKRGVYLAAPITGTMNPTGWTWTVSFDLTYLGTRVPMASFPIDVPAYVPGPDTEDPDTGSVGLIDLALASPVPSSAGNAVTRGLSVVSVGLSGNALVFGLDDGTYLPSVTVPSIAASAASATAAAASATAAASSATAAASSASSFGLDVVSTTTGAAGSSAAVVVTGTTPSYHLAFTVPRGDTGATGPSAPDATASVKGIVQLAGDLGGTAASPTAPTKVDKLAPTAVKTTTYTAAVTDLIPCDATSGGFTVTLPTAPADKARIYIKKIDTSTNAVTIARGGTDVFEKASGATSLTLVTQFQALLLTYNSSAGIWYVSYDLALAALDTRLAALQLATALKTTTYSAAVGEFVPCDATSGGFTVTLPTAPADGAVITIKKIDSGSNTVTVARGGSTDVFNVSGGATSMSITKQDQAQRYVYKASGAIWYVANHISNTDSRLSDTRTPATGTQYYDLSIPAFGKSTTRAAGSGDFPFGVKLQRAATFTSVTYRANAADASGNLVVKLQKNGSDTGMTGSSTTIAAASQVAGGTGTGTWSFAAGDILTVVIVSVGTTPGTGLIADITGLA